MLGAATSVTPSPVFHSNPTTLTTGTSSGFSLSCPLDAHTYIFLTPEPNPSDFSNRATSYTRHHQTSRIHASKPRSYVGLRRCSDRPSLRRPHHPAPTKIPTRGPGVSHLTTAIMSGTETETLERNHQTGLSDSTTTSSSAEKYRLDEFDDRPILLYKYRGGLQTSSQKDICSWLDKGEFISTVEMTDRWVLWSGTHTNVDFWCR